MPKILTADELHAREEKQLKILEARVLRNERIAKRKEEEEKIREQKREARKAKKQEEEKIREQKREARKAKRQEEEKIREQKEEARKAKALARMARREEAQRIRKLKKEVRMADKMAAAPLPYKPDAFEEAVREYEEKTGIAEKRKKEIEEFKKAKENSMRRLAETKENDRIRKKMGIRNPTKKENELFHRQIEQIMYEMRNPKPPKIMAENTH